MMSLAGEQEATAPAVGARVGGRYVLLGPISRGAMGAVHRARDEQSGEQVALKQLTDQSQAARFAIEARLLADLRHPRVVRVRDHFEDAAGSFLVMDLVAGPDLGALAEARGGSLPVEEVLARAAEACEALAYVHAQHVVHRDVKPRNLIAGEQGTVLVDFGVARTVEGAGEGGTRAIGTPQYMAPEILVGEAVSPRSDVYALAATIWTLLAGAPPSYGEPTVLSELVPAVTPALERTLRAGLELAPERRIASVEAFASALGAPLDDESGASLALSVGGSAHDALLEAIVHAAAGVFDAASASIGLVDAITGELVYRAAWGAAAAEVVGVRLPAGAGLAGAAVAGGEGIVVPDCRSDPRFASQVAAGIGYIPRTMLIAPLRAHGGATSGVLQLIDRRDADGYGAVDLERAALFAEIAVAALPPA
jgi:hypothetical protein